MAIGTTFTAFKDPGERLDLQRFASAVVNGLPMGRFQIVPVTFGVANQDTDIAHKLDPNNPEAVHYLVIGASAAGIVYQDNGATRKPWQQTHIFLRSSAIMNAILLLFTGVDSDVSFFT